MDYSVLNTSNSWLFPSLTYLRFYPKLRRKTCFVRSQKKKENTKKHSEEIVLKHLVIPWIKSWMNT